MQTETEKKVMNNLKTIWSQKPILNDLTRLGVDIFDMYFNLTISYSATEMRVS